MAALGHTMRLMQLMRQMEEKTNSKNNNQSNVLEDPNDGFEVLLMLVRVTGGDGW